MESFCVIDLYEKIQLVKTMSYVYSGFLLFDNDWDS